MHPRRLTVRHNAYSQGQIPSCFALQACCLRFPARCPRYERGLAMSMGWRKKLFGTASAPDRRRVECSTDELRIVGCLLVDGGVPVAEWLVVDEAVRPIGSSLCDVDHPLSF